MNNDRQATDHQSRRRRQWLLLWVVVLTIGLGWRWPLLGFSVPVVMIAGMIGGPLQGRVVCGNWCPRGSFFDRVLAPLSRGSGIPEKLRGMPFRWVVMVLLMGFMVYRISLNPADWRHWGTVFWQMCVITTGIGVALGLLFHQRSWCAFCPMGTMQNLMGGAKHQLRIDSRKCIKCRKCEQVCTMKLPIVSYRESGIMSHPDCVKCGKCIAVCPKGALSWPRQQ